MNEFSRAPHIVGSPNASEASTCRCPMSAVPVPNVCDAGAKCLRCRCQMSAISRNPNIGGCPSEWLSTPQEECNVLSTPKCRCKCVGFARMIGGACLRASVPQQPRACRYVVACTAFLQSGDMSVQLFDKSVLMASNRKTNAVCCVHCLTVVPVLLTQQNTRKRQHRVVLSQEFRGNLFENEHANSPHPNALRSCFFCCANSANSIEQMYFWDEQTTTHSGSSVVTRLESQCILLRVVSVLCKKHLCFASCYKHVPPLTT